jgi:hypothetical protein
MVCGDDAQNPCELLLRLKMTPYELRLWHPHVEDDGAHVADKHPIHHLQGTTLTNTTTHFKDPILREGHR